jgi:ABC-2 type transport system ATP-binding protein
MIEVADLTKTFGNVRAVDSLTLHVPGGELFCFLGPNGAGKTTTIRMLTGLMKPDSGTVRVAGFDVQSDPIEAKRLMGYIPDMPYLYERLTPVEFLQFVADLYSVPRPRLEEAVDGSLKEFGLDSHRNSLIGELSHGMRQRLIYVATFLHDPRVLFVDEPLVGLDPYSIRMIKNMLRERTRDGTTVFLTTHILAVAEEIADRIGIIDRGRLIALGSMPELEQQEGSGSGLEDLFLALTADTGETHGEAGCGA